MKNDILEAIAAILLMGVAVLVLVLGIVFTHSRGGNWIGGAAIALGMLATGVLAVVLYVVGLIIAASLRSRGQPSSWRLYTGFVPGAGVALFVLVLVGRPLFAEFEDWQTRRDDAAHKREVAAGEALVADPVRLQAYVAKHGVETRLPSSDLTPLEAATSRNYRNLIETFLAQGARISDPALALAVDQGDVTTFDLLLHHTRFIDGKTFLALPLEAKRTQNALPTGQSALREAFTLGRFDFLERLAQAGVATNDLALELIARKGYLRYFAGEVNWKPMIARWQNPSCPATVRQRVQEEQESSKMPVASFGEKEVLATLDLLLTSEMDVDPAIGFKNLAIPAWMKGGMPSSDWHSTSFRSRVNWAILEAIYPGDLPSVARAKGLAGLQLLAREALDKDGGRGRRLLEEAVSQRSVDVTDLLLQEGFTLELLPTELGAFDEAGDEPMKAYLEAHGRRFPAAK